MLTSIIKNRGLLTASEQEAIVARRKEINATVDHGIRAIFFDLHGVLVDVSCWHRVALLSALQDYGYKVPIPRSDPVWGIYGGTWAQLEYLAKHSRIKSGDMWGIYCNKQDYTDNIIEKRCEPNARVIDVMRYAESVGYRLAVVTNGTKRNAKKMLKACALYDHIEFIITRADVEGKVKPHPRPYLEARYRMGLKNKEALVIDDTSRGIMSAVDARCRTWKLKKPEDLSVRNLMRVMHSYRITL